MRRSIRFDGSTGLEEHQLGVLIQRWMITRLERRLWPLMVRQVGPSLVGPVSKAFC